MNENSKFRRQNEISAVLRREKKLISNGKEIVYVHTATFIPLYVYFMEGF